MDSTLIETTVLWGLGSAQKLGSYHIYDEADICCLVTFLEELMERAITGDNVLYCSVF